jgi:hypothetical protein
MTICLKRMRKKVARKRNSRPEVEVGAGVFTRMTLLHRDIFRLQKCLVVLRQMADPTAVKKGKRTATPTQHRRLVTIKTPVVVVHCSSAKYKLSRR